MRHLLTIGLKSNGTVVAEGYDKEGACNVTNWSNIISVISDNGTSYGLKSDGTVLVTGYRSKRDDTTSWKDIIAIFSDEDYLLGLKADGTVVSTNPIYSGHVSEWKGISVPIN